MREKERGTGDNAVQGFLTPERNQIWQKAAEIWCSWKATGTETENSKKTSPTTVKPSCKSGFGSWPPKVTSAWGSKAFGFEYLVLDSRCSVDEPASPFYKLLWSSAGPSLPTCMETSAWQFAKGREPLKAAAGLSTGFRVWGAVGATLSLQWLQHRDTG